jgi:hypothetical protein
MREIVVAFFGWSNQAQLTIVGGTLEVVGLAMVSVDFWWPWLRESGSRLGRRVRLRAAKALERARLAAMRLLRRRRTAMGETGGLEMALETDVAGKVTPSKAPSLAAMVRQLYVMEERLGAVESRQESDSREIRERLDAMTEAVQEMIRRSKDEYLGWRVFGLAVALSGAVVLSAANLVS